MNKPFPGDTVRCKINDQFIVYNYVDKYDIIETFEIICVVENGYLAKVPIRLYLTNSFLINETKSKEYSIPKNFIDANAHFITDAHILSIKERKDGECCDRCKEYFKYAERNEDGEFRCFLCRNFKYRSGLKV